MDRLLLAVPAAITALSWNILDTSNKKQKTHILGCILLFLAGSALDLTIPLILLLSICLCFEKTRLYGWMLLDMTAATQCLYLVKTDAPTAMPVSIMCFLLALICCRFLKMPDMKEWISPDTDMSTPARYFGILPLIAFVLASIRHFSPGYLVYAMLASALVWWFLPWLCERLFYQQESKRLMLELKAADLKKTEEKRTQLTKLQNRFTTELERVKKDLENGQAQKAAHTLEKLKTAAVTTREQEYLKQPAINALISLKAEECKKQNIPFSFEPSRPCMDLPVLDTCRLLSNLLDNAIRASLEQTNPAIQLKLSQHGTSIAILCQNTCQQDPSTLQHHTGYGRQIMQEIVNRNNGQIVSCWKDRRYEVSIVLPAKEKHHQTEGRQENS